MSRLPRDIFIEEIYKAAKQDKDIYFLNADLGAQALDVFREEMPDQFIHVGISEQNMMDVAAGLALEGKKVYTYAMAPFVSLRCYEQIKVALASMKLPVTIIAVGVGYSYAPAGPTHYATEDVSCMRALAGIEILNPTDNHSAIHAAKLTIDQPALRYIRLDRQALQEVYQPNDVRLDAGLIEIEKGDELCIIAKGVMVQQALQVRSELLKEGISIGVVDAYKIKPINKPEFNKIMQTYQKIVSLEEHFLSGGLGSIVAETLADLSMLKPLKRLGVEDHYYLENGDRHYLQTMAGIDVPSITESIRSFLHS